MIRQLCQKFRLSFLFEEVRLEIDMLKRNAVYGALLASVFALPASAATITALDLNGLVIAAPASVTNAAPVNTPIIHGFNEQSNVLLAADLTMQNYGNPNTIALTGTSVDSHMFFMNQPSGAPNPNVTTTASFSFSTAVLGIITSTSALNNSDMLLGAVGTTYQSGFSNRGLEGADAVSFAGNSVDLTFSLTQPGDWVRVITAADVAPVPLPAGAPLMLAGIGAFAVMRRKAKKS